MKAAGSWNIDDIDGKAREAARRAAEERGMSLGEWLNEMIMREARAMAANPDEKAPASPARADEKAEFPAPAQDDAVGDLARRIDDLANRLEQLSRSEQMTAAGRFMNDADPKILAGIVARIEENEERTARTLEEIGARIEELAGSITRLREEGGRPDGHELEAALRNVMEHIELYEQRNARVLDELRQRLDDVGARAAEALRLAAEGSKREDLRVIEERLQALATRMEKLRGETLSEARGMVESSISGLGEQLQAVHAASRELPERVEKLVTDVAGRRFNEVERHIEDMVGRLRAKLEEMASGVLDVERIGAQVERINKRLDELAEEAVRQAEVEALRETLEKLSLKVEDKADREEVRALAERLEEMTAILKEERRVLAEDPEFAELSRRIDALEQALSELSGRQARPEDIARVEQLVQGLEERLTGAEQQLSYLPQLESSVARLFQSLEATTEETRRIVEETAHEILAEREENAGAKSDVSAEEIAALREGLDAVRAAAEEADTRTQETLKAVHETLERIVDRIAELEESQERLTERTLDLVEKHAEGMAATAAGAGAAAGAAAMAGMGAAGFAMSADPAQASVDPAMTGLEGMLPQAMDPAMTMPGMEGGASGMPGMENAAAGMPGMDGSAPMPQAGEGSESGPQEPQGMQGMDPAAAATQAPEMAPSGDAAAMPQFDPAEILAAARSVDGDASAQAPQGAEQGMPGMQAPGFTAPGAENMGAPQMSNPFGESAEASGLDKDFIAAARRAAQAAAEQGGGAQQHASGETGSLLDRFRRRHARGGQAEPHIGAPAATADETADAAATEAADDTQSTSALSGLMDRLKGLTGKSAGKDGAQKSANPGKAGEEGGSRRGLLIAAAALLVAVLGWAYTQTGGGDKAVMAPAEPVVEKAPAENGKGAKVKPGKETKAGAKAKAKAKSKVKAKAGSKARKHKQRSDLLAPEKDTPTRLAETGAADALQTASITRGDDPARMAAVTATSTAAATRAALAEQAATAAASEEPLPLSLGTPALRIAAQKGDARAMYLVGIHYMTGKEVTKDPARAAVWFRKAAEKGLVPAQYRLGLLYERGIGVAKDLQKARQWYERAAKAGNVKAMHNLAVLLASSGEKADYAQAAEWFRAAAEHGLRDSQYNLAVLHQRGLGVKADNGQAYYWYGVAARTGDADAAQRKEALAPYLDAKTRTDLDKRSAAFAPRRARMAANIAVFDPAWRKGDAAQAAKAGGEKVEKAALTADVADKVLKDQKSIRRIQELLSKLGFDPGPADGVMGVRTSNAIRLFQLQTGMRVNGQPTRAVLQRLEERFRNAPNAA
ncbi:peptidoglycan-binding protein [Thermopetrobacter sp. TC1]|uniref:peptidoglycan-binding protein n=1 Tax=Thermopetrobacter sp. TC1 TaxID=1495045 RepID=UPI000690471D|nr:peptidoglycan-binding protein [Thermopetrobacter sp. TC1]